MTNKPRTGRFTMEVRDPDGEISKMLERARAKLQGETKSEVDAIIARIKAASLCVDVKVRAVKNTELLRHLLTYYLAGDPHEDA